MIQIRHLNKYYHKGKANEIHVIHDTSLTLGDTGLVCILGESGSGKTTLMNTISGLDDFYKGEIQVDDVLIRKYGEKKQQKVQNEKFGYIFQNYYLLQDRTVEYNLMLALSLYEIPDEEKEERIDYVLKAVDMWKYKKRPISQLSGGQQQRIAIARALAKAPQVIFADEPTGNLDEANTMRIMGILKKISKTCLVVVVTHEKSIANFFADRILWISDGKIQDSSDEGSDAYEYVEDTNLYLQEYPKTETEEKGVKLEIYQKEEMPPVRLRVIFENGKAYLHTDKPENIVFLSQSDEKKMIDEKKPVVEMEDMEQMEYHLERIDGAKKPKMSVREICDIAKTNLKWMGKKQIFLILSMIITAVLFVLTMEDILSITRVDTKSIVSVDENYCKISAAKNDMISDQEYEDCFALFAEKVRESGMETYILPHLKLTYRYNGYEQVRDMDYTIHNYFFADIERLSEETLIYGRMPEKETEIVVDKWVLENYIDESDYIRNIMPDVESALGSAFMSEKGIALTICGICESNQPDIYINRDIVVMLSQSNLDYRTESVVAALYEDYEPGQVGIGEDGVIQILVDENTLKKRFQTDTEVKYQELKQAYNSLEMIQNQISLGEQGNRHWGGYSDEDAKEDLKEAEEKYEQMVEKFGMTMEEYLEYVISDAYLEYTYEDSFAGDLRYRVVGYFPEKYGFQYLLSDDAANVLENAVVNTYKECYVYVGGNLTGEEREEKVKEVLTDELANNISIQVENVYHTEMSAHKKEVKEHMQTSLLMVLTVVIISMVLLYFMMKANAIARMQDLGVYRMLGISKLSILGMFGYETILITSMTALPASLLTLFVTYVIGKIPMMNMEFYYPWYCFVGTVLVLYLLNLVIGILPIRKMLKLPPAQLASKYDI